jgi:hypothetical protein
MRKLRKFAAAVSLFAVAGGCATMPTEPNVMVLPAAGKSFETFRQEDATCRQWAEQRIGTNAPDAAEQSTVNGAVAGTVIGTGVGALLGSASRNTGIGALFGGLTGLMIGTAAGANSGQVYGDTAQHRYDNAYLQCMYSYGNQLPGYRAAVTPAAAPQVMVAPPPAAVAAPPGAVYTAPEDIYFEEAPRFIYSPDLNVYVAVGVPYDLIYDGSGYFYFYGGRWYQGPYYYGPWRYAGRRSYPSFVRYRIDNVRYYRDVEYRRFERDGSRYTGRFYRPEYRVRRR